MPDQGRDVSVALCTFNGARFVGAQVESILAQTHLPREIVLSDDASSDDTLRIAHDAVASFAQAHPDRSIRLVKIRNAVPLGVVANFEQAMRRCSFGLIALCDQDDLWRTNRIERAVARFAADRTLDLLHSDADLVDEHGKRMGTSLFEALEVDADTQLRIHDGNAFDLLMRRNVVTGATTMVRHRLITAALPVPQGWVHDEWLAAMASTVGRMDVLPDRLIEYRQHNANQIGVRRLGFAGKFKRMMEPGEARNARLLGRAQSLVDRFESLGDSIPNSTLEVVRAKLEHEKERSNLAPHRVTRVIPVLRELRTGRYTQFGRGVADAARDLLQPHSRRR